MATAKKAIVKKATDGTATKRKTKTVSDIKIELEKARKKLATLEQRAYASELKEAIDSSGIVAAFKKIEEGAKSVKPINILAAIGAAVGIKRLVITQKDAVERASTKVKTPANV